MIPKNSTALMGTTGFVVAGAAAAGIAGYFLWKNRDSILEFVGQYVDLPESLQASDAEADFESDLEDNDEDQISSSRSSSERHQSL